jgi:hypothetical protein
MLGEILRCAQNDDTQPMSAAALRAERFGDGVSFGQSGGRAAALQKFSVERRLGPGTLLDELESKAAPFKKRRVRHPERRREVMVGEGLYWIRAFAPLRMTN